MKEMIKRVREEKGGFTLAELLIVVAIILVLVAIAVPVFTGAMDKANNAVKNSDIATVRHAAATKILLDTGSYDDDSGNLVGPWKATATVDGTGTVGAITIAPWGTGDAEGAEDSTGGNGGYDVTAKVVATDVTTTP